MSKSKNIAAALLVLFAFGTGNGPQTMNTCMIETTHTAVVQEA